MSSTTTTATTTTATAQFPTGVQYGFFFDQSRCIGCQNCALACKSKRQIPPGQIRLLRLYQWETGAFPGVRVNTLFAPCYHCANPVCIPAAKGALIKEPTYGAVLIDPDLATSSDLKAAWAACPYGAISFDSDSPDSTAYKCDMCIDRLQQGMLPACVLVCPTRALDFGKFADMQSKYGTNSDLAEMPSSASTSPAIVFKPHAAKQQLVPYDSGAALQLFAQRGSLPLVYSSPSDVTTIPPGIIGRSELKMKASGQELILRTTDDSL